jgi:hypothetical protein
VPAPDTPRLWAGCPARSTRQSESQRDLQAVNFGRDHRPPTCTVSANLAVHPTRVTLHRATPLPDGLDQLSLSPRHHQLTPLPKTPPASPMAKAPSAPPFSKGGPGGISAQAVPKSTSDPPNPPSSHLYDRGERPLPTLSLSYRSSAAIRCLPRRCFVEPVREPPPAPWKQSFGKGAPKPELGCKEEKPPPVRCRRIGQPGRRMATPNAAARVTIQSPAAGHCRSRPSVRTTVAPRATVAPRKRRPSAPRVRAIGMAGN